jgi:hypothetical protein
MHLERTRMLFPSHPRQKIKQARGAMEWLLDMVSNTKLTKMDAAVKAFFATRFASAPMYQAELIDLWTTYKDLGLPNDDFVAELINGKPPSLAQRTWEMLLARHLHEQGHELRCLGRGPDLRFEHLCVTIWVEAVTPEPKGLFSLTELYFSANLGTKTVARSSRFNALKSLKRRKDRFPAESEFILHTSLLTIAAATSPSRFFKS